MLTQGACRLARMQRHRPSPSGSWFEAFLRRFLTLGLLTMPESFVSFIGMSDLHIEFVFEEYHPLNEPELDITSD